jgi:hypothetical protein
MGLIIWFDCCPSPRGNVADDGLTALVHMNVLDGNLLLSLAAMPYSELPATLCRSATTYSLG